MDERKAVRECSDEELSEDPLLFLGCGHAFPLSTLDGTLALADHYSRGADGAWSAALKPEVGECAVMQM